MSLRNVGNSLQATSIKGWLVGIQQIPIVIYFSINPSTIRDTKATGWESKERYGQIAPANKWSKGGARTLTFTIYLDSNVQGYGTSVELDLASYQSLLYPKYEADFSSFISSLQSFAGLSSRQGAIFRSPPKVIFGFGFEVLECVVLSMPIQKQAFNSALACIRAKIDITLQVVGDSKINAGNDAKRRAMALVGSAKSVMDAVGLL